MQNYQIRSFVYRQKYVRSDSIENLRRMQLPLFVWQKKVVRFVYLFDSIDNSAIANAFSPRPNDQFSSRTGQMNKHTPNYGYAINLMHVSMS